MSCGARGTGPPKTERGRDDLTAYDFSRIVRSTLEDRWDDDVHVPTGVSGGDNYATFMIEMEGRFFNVAISRVRG